MKRFITAFTLALVVSLSAHAQLNIQRPVSETITSLRNSKARLAKLANSDTYVLYIRHEVGDDLFTFVLGHSKESAISTLTDLRSLLPIEEQYIPVKDADGRDIKLRGVKGNVAFIWSTIDYINPCWLSKKDLDKLIRALQ